MLQALKEVGSWSQQPDVLYSKCAEQKLVANLINQDLMNVLHTFRLHNAIKKLLHLQVLCSSQVLCFTYLPAESYTGFAQPRMLTEPMIQSLGEDSRNQGLETSRVIVV